MINNDVLRNIRFIFDFNNKKMISIFELGGGEITREQLILWLKKEDEPDFIYCEDPYFLNFLNGLIIEKRGKKEGAAPPQNERVTNNAILMKLKIALNLKSQDLIEILTLTGFQISAHELTAFSRRKGHRHYRECMDQFLRNFLKGLRLKMRNTEEDTSKTQDSDFIWPSVETNEKEK